MRIDKFLSITGTATRSEAKKAIRASGVTVNGVPVKSGDMHIEPSSDKVLFFGKEIIYREHIYIMMNKPNGVVSATDDTRETTVIDILPQSIKKDKLFPCGRLDKNTLGLILITDDGDLAHELLSPKSHVSKSYRFEAAEPISKEGEELFKNGVTLADGYCTLPAEIELDESRRSGIITLKEGKYHQIKRMLGALNNKIIYLERISFGPLTLDENLKRGEWRYLNEDEEALLKKHKKTISGD